MRVRLTAVGNTNAIRFIVRMSALLAVGLVVAVVLGCGGVAERGSPQPTMVPGDSGPAAPIVEGQYVWGHEVRSFRPCGSAGELWVVGAPEVLDPVNEEYRKLADTPYQPVLVRFVGKRAEAPTVGFGAEYDGAFRVRDVLEIRRAVASDCP